MLKTRVAYHRKKWVVARFVRSQDYTVIPINWLDQLVEDEDGLYEVEYCRWPNIHITSDDLIDADEPDVSWTIYEIRVMYGEIYTNFKRAWYKQVELESNMRKTVIEYEPDDIDDRSTSWPRFDREPLTITDILATSPVNCSQIGDGSVSLSPVPKKKNTGTFGLSPRTQSNTHLMIRRLSPEVEMVDLGAARSSATTPDSDSKKNKKTGLYANNKHDKPNDDENNK